PIGSPVAGLRLSNVSPPSASTHSPPMKFWKVRAVVATDASLALDPYLDGRERPGHAGPAPVAGHTPLVVALVAGHAAAVGPAAAVDDHGHVRIVGVVGDQLVVELVLELDRYDAVD